MVLVTLIICQVLLPCHVYASQCWVTPVPDQKDFFVSQNQDIQGLCRPTMPPALMEVINWVRLASASYYTNLHSLPCLKALSFILHAQLL